jgi:23S rRNA G2445 N2-methylase RlmL
MASSGTLLLEGVIMAADVAPHLMRIKCGLASGGKSQTYPPVVRWKHNVGGGDKDDNEVNVVMEEWKRLLQDATVRAKKGLAWLTTETSLSNIELIAGILVLWTFWNPLCIKLA